MPTGPLLRRPSSALIGLLVLALSAGLGAAWLSGPCAVLQPELNTGAPIEAEGTLPMLAAPIESSAQPQASARVELDPGTQTQSPLTQDAGLRLRFVRGSTGKSAGVLGVRLLETSEDGDSLAVQAAGALLAEGRSDINGWFEAPASARSHAFKIELDAGDGAACTALPTIVRPRMLPADGSGFEVEVLAAWASFEALVLDAGGAPVSGASVQFDFESPAFAFSTRDAPSSLATTDEKGLARIELVDPASSGGRMRIKAESSAELHSESIELPPPLKTTHVELHLSTRARAILRVESSAGSPLAGAMARIEQIDPPYARVGRTTDADGTARFMPIEPGRYVASAEDPSSGSSAREEFTIARCQIADLRLKMPPSDLPLAVAGHVRAANGAAISWLWVSICVDGCEEARIAPDNEGRFEYHRAPCERLRVRLKAPFDGPQVEPEVVDAPFGSRDLVFVLSDAPRMGFTALRVVDAETGAPLNGVAAAVFRDSAAERIGGVVSALAGSAMALASNEAGLLFVPSGAQLPRAQLIVEKRGYIRREIDLSDLALLPERDGKPTLELRRGFMHRWLVRDARSGLPIPGAIATRGVDPFSGRAIEDGSNWGPSAPSDERGILELSLPNAPRRVSIQAPGYRPRAVDAGQASVALPIEEIVLLESEH